MITIEQLSPSLAMTLKDVRLRALQDTPSAFGSTYAKESRLPDEEWLVRANTWNGERSVGFIAMQDGAPCGVVAGKVDMDDPQTAHVLSMWVAPEQRRTGLGGRLLSAVQLWARDLGVPRLRLMVTNNNSTAINFYQRWGFMLTGKTEPYPNDPALFEYEMIKSLANL